MRECLYCGKPVKNKYCNTSCQNKDRIGNKMSLKSIKKLKETIANKWKEFNVKCECCDKEFRIKEFNVDEPKKMYYFCSKSCSNHRIQTDITKNKIRKTVINNLYNTFKLDDIEIKIQEDILNMRKNGSTYQEIYNNTNGLITKENIRLLCNKNGLSHFGRLNDDEIIDIKKLYEELKNIRKVARITGYSRDTIKNHIVINKLSIDDIKKNRINAVISWRKRTKIKLVEYKGGCCQVCEYNKSIGALEFHHVDPNEKDFTISAKSYAFERLKKEVDKCVLLCSNCHIEVHEEIKKTGYSEIINKIEQFNKMLV